MHLKSGMHVTCFYKQVFLLGCLGSTATLTMGVASKLSGMNGGQEGKLHRVADFSTKSWRPPIPARRKKIPGVNTTWDTEFMSEKQQQRRRGHITGERGLDTSSALLFHILGSETIRRGQDFAAHSWQVDVKEWGTGMPHRWTSSLVEGGRTRGFWHTAWEGGLEGSLYLTKECGTPPLTTPPECIQNSPPHYKTQP